jgi:4-oxalmesaconate hydratase
MIHRVCSLFPDNFVGVCQLPQSPGIAPSNCVEELERCVTQYGFVGCNVNPDPSDGYWTDPPMTDRWWYPLYEKMVELRVPGMIHVSSSCNPNFHGTGAHYINGDTSTFMQFILADLFKDIPDLKFVIPHGGGAVPYHWGRYRGIAQDANRPPIETLLNNVCFDTCVYGYRGSEVLVREVGADGVIFASEMIGAVKSIDPKSGHYFDDTKRYIDAITDLSEADRTKIYEGNALRVYPRLAEKLAKRPAAV